MPVVIAPSAPAELSLVDLQPRGEVYPSPVSWRDQILYFLLPDRFSDGGETQRPRFDRGDPERCKTADKGVWMAAGKTFQGGTLKGIESKLDYLKGLDVTALWIGPVWRQRPDLDTYHGYGIQNFLDVDPRFGTRQDLRDLVDAAHARKLYVLLDVIYASRPRITPCPLNTTASGRQCDWIYPRPGWQSWLRRLDGTWKVQTLEPALALYLIEVGRIESWEVIK